MSRWFTSVLVAGLGVAAAFAQFPSEVVGFNGPPIDDEATSQEMFRVPEFSGSTVGFIIPNDAGQFNQNAAFRASGLQTEGAAALEVLWRWIDPADSAAWVRLSTFNGPGGRPNPSLHTLGKVRFKITNRSELFNGDVGVVLGIRETGENVPQLDDGGTIGNIEWVGATGVVTDPNSGAPLRPIPALIVQTGPAAVNVEFNLATGNVTLNGVSQGGGIFGFTGDGVMNAPNDRGVLEHIAFINLAADPAVLIDVAIDELQFEATVPDPVLPPTVVAPIIADDNQVTVTDLLLTVNRVTLLRDGFEFDFIDVANNDDVVFNLPAGQEAVTGEAFTATQRDGVTGLTSDESDPVVVLPEASPYGLAFVVDEDGDGSCSFDPPGGWEMVGATDLTSAGAFLYPSGTPLFLNNARWQTVEISLTNPDIVQPWLGGNGALDSSPTGFRTLDTIWLNVAAGAGVGPHEIFFDSIELLDAGDNVLNVIHDFEDGTLYMNQIRGQSNTTFSSSGLSALSAYDGQTSHRVTWTYADNIQKALGLLTRQGFTCGTSPQFTDQGEKIRFRILARTPLDPNDAPLPEVAGPIVGPQTSVRVNCDPNATSVQLYINGVEEGAPVNPAGATELDFNGLTLALGDSVSATQVVGGDDSPFAYPRVASGAPPPPAIVGTIFPGATSVDVGSLLAVPFATADFVAVYRNGAFAGSAAVTGDPTSVPITFGGALQEGQVVTATQFVNNLESPPSVPVSVGIPGPTIYAAPPDDASSVRVIGVDPGASAVDILVNGGATVFSTDPGGATQVDVPVNSLVAGDTLTARMTVGGSPSGESDPETVTVAGRTTVLCDDFEYDQATYESLWLDSAAPRPTLSTAQNTTDGGMTSLFGEEAGHRVQQALPSLVTPTATEPLVWNVNIYDPSGPGVSGDNWAQIIETVADFFLLHIGMSSFFLANADLDRYQVRIIGNGGPDWFNLTEHDAPVRSVGWHAFTMVHKGEHIDIYVDGLLSAKNVPVLGGESTLGLARIGPGFNAPSAGGFYDDFCIELGAVRFNQVGSPPGCEGDVNGDNVRDLVDLAILLSNFGTVGGATPEDGDLDGDMDVDITDLAIILSVFGEPCP